MSTTPDQRLARTFVTLADTLVADFDVLDFLCLLTERSVEHLAVDAAGVILSDQRGGWRPAASSTERPDLIGLFTAQAEQGPCSECVVTGAPVTSSDLSTPHELSRWPRFAPAALDAGFRAASAVPLRLREQTIGALTLLNHEPTELDADTLSIAQALADIATIGFLHHRAVTHDELLYEQLETTMHQRAIIEQAKGVLAEYGNLDMDQAFTHLRHYAHTQRRRLSAIARELAEDTLHPSAILTRKS
ncbi:GAF domain-containing protein [Amycolatopsis lurida]|uniref:Transcriptional regulator n=1 Tax=Amycolatopsis lurida NRRL 2430 TaxID=1460371 RepID=A0A2P2FJW3_AMYLU|nr:GAF and ANTAR domain-containing protein [Amycolatopsis lurida]KFU77017.1 transcriptional regulator [Amycolatopsis lurida NRRL 2430]SED50497.1 GAF domain-containing protein [Amycolatopsis lurida]